VDKRTLELIQPVNRPTSFGGNNFPRKSIADKKDRGPLQTS